jgi:double-stranded uracil-DNA glycosylase
VKGSSGSDRALRFDHSDGLILRSKVTTYHPACLCFNGKRSAQEFLAVSHVEFGVQPDQIGGTVLFVAPSTSAAANGTWNLALWQELADLVSNQARARRIP